MKRDLCLRFLERFLEFLPLLCIFAAFALELPGVLLGCCRADAVDLRRQLPDFRGVIFSGLQNVSASDLDIRFQLANLLTRILQVALQRVTTALVLISLPFGQFGVFLGRRDPDVFDVHFQTLDFCGLGISFPQDFGASSFGFFRFLPAISHRFRELFLELFCPGSVFFLCALRSLPDRTAKLDHLSGKLELFLFPLSPGAEESVFGLLLRFYGLFESCFQALPNSLAGAHGVVCPLQQLGNAALKPRYFLFQFRTFAVPLLFGLLQFLFAGNLKFRQVRVFGARGPAVPGLSARVAVFRQGVLETVDLRIQAPALVTPLCGCGFEFLLNQGLLFLGVPELGLILRMELLVDFLTQGFVIHRRGL